MFTRRILTTHPLYVLFTYIHISHIIIRIRTRQKKPDKCLCRCSHIHEHVYKHKYVYSDRTMPSEHETLSHCWFNVGPPSTTLAQHWTNNGSKSRVCWVCSDDIVLPYQEFQIGNHQSSVDLKSAEQFFFNFKISKIPLNKIIIFLIINESSNIFKPKIINLIFFKTNKKTNN